MGGHIAGNSIYSTGGRFCCHYGNYWNYPLFLPPFFIMCFCTYEVNPLVKYFVSVYVYFQFATTLIFGWWEEGTISRVEWRCASRDNGGQCVMMTGIPEMQQLSADSLVSPQNVN